VSCPGRKVVRHLFAAVSCPDRKVVGHLFAPGKIPDAANAAGDDQCRK
jgi:hypothetical protein